MPRQAMAEEDRAFLQKLLLYINERIADASTHALMIKECRTEIQKHLLESEGPLLPRFEADEPLWPAGNQCLSPAHDEDVEFLVAAAKADPNVRARNDGLDMGELAPGQQRLRDVDAFWIKDIDARINWVDITVDPNDAGGQRDPDMGVHEDSAVAAPAANETAAGSVSAPSFSVLTTSQPGTAPTGIAQVGTHDPDSRTEETAAGPCNAPPPSTAPKSRKKRKAAGPPAPKRQKIPRAVKRESIDYRV